MKFFFESWNKLQDLPFFAAVSKESFLSHFSIMFNSQCPSSAAFPGTPDPKASGRMTKRPSYQYPKKRWPPPEMAVRHCKEVKNQLLLDLKNRSIPYIPSISSLSSIKRTKIGCELVDIFLHTSGFRHPILVCFCQISHDLTVYQIQIHPLPVAVKAKLRSRWLWYFLNLCTGTL